MDKQIVRILQELQEENAALSTLCPPFTDETLAAYIDAELSGRAGAEFDPAFYNHLQSCASCGQTYAELKHLFQLEQADALAVPPLSPHFDFSYLAQGAAVPQAPAAARPEQSSGYLDVLGRFIIRFSEALLAAYRPSPMAYSLRQGESGLIYELSLPQALEDLEVTIAVHEERAAPHLCSVQVEVEIPSRGGWPNLAGIAVSLTDEAMPPTQAVRTQQTDAFGKTLFQGVTRADLPHLVFAIETGQGSSPAHR